MPEVTIGTMRTTSLWALAWTIWLLVALVALGLHAPWPLGQPPDQTAGIRATEAQRPTFIPCLSYAPFRRPGHTPTDPDLRITDEQLLEDLRILARSTGCVRVYGTSHGQDRIPALAASLGLEVVVGAWISRDRAASQREVDTALALAHAHPGVVRMVIIGNEVLLRQERSPEELAALLSQARNRSPVPVAYADVWEFWLRHAQIMVPAVDVVAIHILPYWEDEPVALKQAVGHVVSIHTAVRKALPEKTVWLAETGWPSAGRQRGPALPGLQEQALFVRELTAELADRAIDFNLIEGFDQPWKRQLEGGMGGAWGIVDAQGQLKDRGGSMMPRDPAVNAALAGAAIGLAGAGLFGAGLLAAGARRRQRSSPCLLPGIGMEDSTAWDARLLHGCAAATAGLLLGAHAATAAVWLRAPAEWAMAAASLLAAMGVCAAGLWCPKALSGRSPLLTVMLFLAALNAITLVFDGRYRPVLALLWAAPALVLWLANQRSSLEPVRSEDRLLAAVLPPCAVALLFIEGAANTQAWALAGAWCVMAAAVWAAPHKRCPAAAIESSAGSSVGSSVDCSSLSDDKAQSKAASADRSVS